MKLNIKDITIKSAHDGLEAKKFTSEELTRACLDEIKKRDGEIKSFLEVFEESVLVQARASDERIKAGKRIGVLDGIPLAIKDNILIEGKIASSASKILENYHATYDATVISKLKSAGAVFLGRTNMDEFAMGSSTENSAYQITRNPWDLDRVPGGSSGGSGASVAGGMALGALGSDTGGSVRQPSALCGLVGLKPTYGAVSRYGLMAMASSLDQISPFAKTVEDAEILFDTIKGKDPMDSTSRENLGTRQLSIGKKLGIPKGILDKGVAEDILKNFNDTVAGLKKAGYEIVEVDLPNLKYSLPVYYIIMPAEASTNLARFDGVRFGLHQNGENLFGDYKKTRGVGFGREVRKRIILGSYVLSSGYYDTYYKKAKDVQNLIQSDFLKVFSGPDAVSAIITPTAPSPAFKVGEKANDPLKMYLEDIFTVSANIAGIPAISVPSGFDNSTGKKLPIGFQIMAPHFREDTLFVVGKDVEKIANFVR